VAKTKILQQKQIVVAFIIFTILMIAAASCNNPFSTRKAEKGESTGAAIKPANSPENVLHNLWSSFGSMSIYDYMDIFTEDFVFNPDPADSVEYEQDFMYGWGYEEEMTFAENFLQKTVASEIEFTTHSYEYKAGEDLYDYIYSIMIFSPDSTVTSRTDVKGHAWLYLKENEEGKWKIYKWTEIRQNSNEQQNDTGSDRGYSSWGVLRAMYIGL
jgi:hypothetical protein